MGTNFYVVQSLTDKEKEEMKSLIDNDLFDEAKRMIPKSIHIGKRSGGWKFIFNHNDWKYYKDMDELKEFIRVNKFVDEYGQEINRIDFWEDVERRQSDGDMLDADSYDERWEEFHPNQSKPFYMTSGKETETIVEGYRFSTSTEFS